MSDCGIFFYKQLMHGADHGSETAYQQLRFLQGPYMGVNLELLYHNHAFLHMEHRCLHSLSCVALVWSEASMDKQAARPWEKNIDIYLWL